MTNRERARNVVECLIMVAILPAIALGALLAAMMKDQELALAAFAWPERIARALVPQKDGDA